MKTSQKGMQKFVYLITLVIANISISTVGELSNIQGQNITLTEPIDEDEEDNGGDGGEGELFIPGPGPGDGDNEDNNDNGNNLELEVITKGCFGDGLGYYKEGPKICYPIKDNGELQIEPPKDVSFCAALGCPYNPPDLS